MSRTLKFDIKLPTGHDSQDHAGIRRGTMSRHKSRKTRGRMPWPRWLPPRPNRPELVPYRCDRKELMRGPQRLTWLALSEVRNPKNRDIVEWIIWRVDHNAGLNPTALIREVGLKHEIAVQVLHRMDAGGPGWVEWADSNVRAGNSSAPRETPIQAHLPGVVNVYREIVGKAEGAA
ncbi:MAG: hypothetical protein ACHQQS_00850 [Thermoanaerobaculales bacterium]